MDPRIQSRRIDVMRAKGRRRLRVLLLIVAVLSLGVGGYFLSKSSLFDVDEIVIEGVPEEQKERSGGQQAYKRVNLYLRLIVHPHLTGLRRYLVLKKPAFQDRGAGPLPSVFPQEILWPHL